MEHEKENSDAPIVTGDGSHTLLHTELRQHYHSLQGSVQESIHIFINLGLKPVFEANPGREVRVFEMGFGTGLNALLTWHLADEREHAVSYTGIEAYPISMAQSEALNYNIVLGKDGLQTLHSVEWGTDFLSLSAFFRFRKYHVFLEDYVADDVRYDCVYFDAFAPSSQPELWTEEVFRRLASMIIPGGFLVTYSSKGSVRRALEAAGFEVEKHPGPGRKREVIRAVRK